MCILLMYVNDLLLMYVNCELCPHFTCKFAHKLRVGKIIQNKYKAKNAKCKANTEILQNRYLSY